MGHLVPQVLQRGSQETRSVATPSFNLLPEVFGDQIKPGVRIDHQDSRG
jgi:hypothetical protein